ncbi:PAS/PAC sensor hybrid histidine kinase [Crinalium epipsammum PCC 9333]|uniref:Circadian input-output histidine kinase CikA n=1 Tax=Crinalium epipsammum PCC 9333 TaxID=1173022 RepID=K9W4Y0_9CYAN|nr:response regulator [Crinalium epipsammum]AFZ15413.1 PAS/PAC sensor hybrid histidine kinase [Crinalium epipsammum PCC 9333]
MDEQPPITILNVDDSTVGRYAITRTLQQAGFAVKEAATGKEALRLAAQLPDLIILDVKLPDMSGFQVCETIKANPETFSIPILHLSAKYVSSEDKVQGLDSGADAYLVQPVEPIELIATVKALLRIKQAEEIAKSVAQQWNTTFDSINDGVCLLDSQGRVLRCNQAIIDLFKNLSVDLVGQFFSELAESFFDSNQIDELTTIQHTDIRKVLELKSGNSWFRVTADPVLNKKGVCTGSVYILSDITERKSLEETLQKRAEELQQANQIKDEFLATLSHELRTPLNSMLGWARLLRTRKFDQTTTNRALETIERNANVQSQLIEDILDVSRMITGKHRLNICPVELVAVIEGAMNAVRPAAEAKEIELHTVLASSNNLILGDSDRLQQILWNLLSNAIKFTPNHGRVELRLENINSQVEIQVSDTGRGINHNFLPYVFDRFRQADGTTTRTHAGLGLGLAIVRHLVELHGGTVQATSLGEGLGATFTVKLPIATNFVVENVASKKDLELITTAENTTVKNNLILQGVQILAIDDQTDSLDFLAAGLEEYGAVVTTATSADEALKALSKLQLDLLISDIGMPEVDGYELIHQVRNLGVNNQQIPAIALTAYAREEDRNHAIAAGFQNHVPKPVDLNELVKVVASLTKRIVQV